MFLLLFALFDIVVGASLFFVGSIPAVLLLLVGSIALTKGIISVAGSAVQSYLLDWMGWVDVIAGVILLMHWSVPIFWLLPIVKGVWSALADLMK